MGIREDWREVVEKWRDLIENWQRAWPEIKEGMRKIVEGESKVDGQSSSEQSFIRVYAQTVLAGLKPNEPYIAVGLAENFLLEALDLPAPTEIRLSAQTIASHYHHKKASAAAYAAIIPQIMLAGIWIKRQKDGRVSAYLPISYLPLPGEENIWEMGIKRTKKDELYIPTLHRCEPRRLRKMLQHDIILRGEILLK